jgi:hypothetical protein
MITAITADRMVRDDLPKSIEVEQSPFIQQDLERRFAIHVRKALSGTAPGRVVDLMSFTARSSAFPRCNIICRYADSGGKGSRYRYTFGKRSRR